MLEEIFLRKLEADFPEFHSKLASNGDAVPEETLPGASAEDIAALEIQLGIPLPESYKRFLRIARGFWLFGGAVQFAQEHPFVHCFPRLEELNSSQRHTVDLKGGSWPPPSDGMLCIAEYFRDADGDQVLFDVSKGLVNGEYPVMYYSHETRPPFVEKVADSFEEWLNHRCIDQMS